MADNEENDAAAKTAAADAQTETPAQTPTPKKKHRVPVWAAVLLTVVGLGVGGAAGYIAKPTTQTVTIDSKSIPENFQKVLQVYSTIKNNYVTPSATKKLADGAITGMVNSLDDPFSNYLQNTDATSLNTQISGSFGGIGATMMQTSDGVKVDSVNSGSAARRPASRRGTRL